MTTLSIRQYDYTRTCTSAAQAMHAALQFTDKKHISLVDVMGMTGLAFRLNIDANDVNVAAPTGWNWGTVLYEGLLRLGVKSSCLGAPNHTSPHPEELVEAISFIQDSIDKGIPVVGWDLFCGEFGLIYGYDDDRRVLLCRDVRDTGELPYEQLGRNDCTELFVLRIDETFTVDPRSSLSGTLQAVVDHTRQQRPEAESPYFHHGLGAYDAWIEVFRLKHVEPFGNAYSTMVAAGAREFAARFLLEQAGRWEGDTPVDTQLRSLMTDASNQYILVADALSDLQRMYPFPQGGNPNDADHSEQSMKLLQNAKAAEARGIQLIEKMLTLM